jgi:hypothetical protein
VSTIGIIQATASIAALLVSCGALIVAFRAFRQARNTSLLVTRLEAIKHVRAAVSDVVIHGNIRNETAASVRDAYQLSLLVFGSAVSARLDSAFGIAFRLQHKPVERWTDKDDSDRELLVTELSQALADMNALAAVIK